MPGLPEPDDATVSGVPALVVVGVTGGIAAYKAAAIVRGFRALSCDVQVVATSAALRFVGAPTWAALSGRPVLSSVWDDPESVAHVQVGRQVDLMVVAPATADFLARSAAGRADDALAAILLMARCPVVVAPAMHTEMWQHPATQANVASLRARGVLVLEPDDGPLTGTNDSGSGRLPEPAVVVDAALGVWGQTQRTGHRVSLDLAGRMVVISAGGTRESLDPVRFLSNDSSGRQGYALAAAAALRGAQVHLVSTVRGLPIPPGVQVHPVVTALDLHNEMQRLALDADVLVMAAAVADYRPEQPSDTKLKKRSAVIGGATDEDSINSRTMTLVPNPDILRGLVQARADSGRSTQVVVGFAAETGDESGDPLTLAQQKITRKGCDLLVVNDVSDGQVFGSEATDISILGPSGSVLARVRGPKTVAAHAVLDAVVCLLTE